MANDLSINLCAYWKLDDSSTGTAINSLSSGNLSAYLGPKQDVSGLLGSAVQYDSSTSTFQNTSVRPFPGDVSGLTVSLWVYPDVSLSTLGRSWQMIRSGTSPNCFSIQIYNANNNISGYIYDVSNSYIYHSSTTSVINAKQWNHVVVTWAINANPSIYVNAVNRTNYIQYTGTTGPFTKNIAQPNTQFNLGNGYAGNALAGPGKLDEIGIWTRALSAQEVSLLYNGGSGFSLPFIEEEPPLVDLSTNLLAYWGLEETTGTTVYDSTYNNNDGTSYNTPTLQSTGIVNKCYTFSKGSNECVSLGTSFGNVGTSDWSIQTWINVPTPTDGSFYGIIGKWNAWPYYYMAVWTDGKIIARLNFDDITDFDTYSNSAISANTWYHVILTADRNGYTSLYINGVKQTDQENISAHSSVNVTNSNNFNIGNIGDQLSTFYFNGRIDEPAIWNRLLTATEVSTLYNNGAGLVYPFTGDSSAAIDLSTGLQSYWKLDETTGSTLYDSVGVNHFTNSNAVIGSTDSVIGYSVEFDTSTDYIQDTTISGLDASNNKFSVSCWAKFDSLPMTAGYNMNLIRFQSNQGPYSNSATATIGMSGFNDSYNYVACYTTNMDGSSLGVETGTSKITFATNTWYHLVFTYNGDLSATDVSRGIIYVNGVNCRVWSNNLQFVNPTIVQPNYYVCAGNSYGGARTGIDGKLDEIGYWNRVLTPTEVSTLYNNGSGLSYPFSEASTASVPTVTTSSVTDISTHTATGGGSIVSDGGSSILSKGVCWDTAANPTVSGGDGSTNEGTGTSSFISYLSNLTDYTTYYVRAYAYNSAGVGYGLDVSFNTLLAGKIYYVRTDGSDNQSGLSDASAWKTIAKVNSASINDGDRILFNRGDTWERETINPHNGSSTGGYVYYGAYGSGNKPLFVGSITQNSLSDWTNVGTNLWQNSNAAFTIDVGNIVFNNSSSCGYKLMTASPSFTTQGQFWYDYTNDRIRMYSVGNPASVYSDIKCCLSQKAITMEAFEYVIFQDMEFKYWGDHVVYMRQQANHNQFLDLTISFIGGMDMLSDYTVRYGNGIDCWNGSNDITIERCIISECYDAGISPQGGTPDNYWCYNWFVRNNIIYNCEYSWEYFFHDADTSAYNIFFENNTCLYAGGGWGHSQRPDGARGRHVRIGQSLAAEASIYVRNNIFYEATEAIFYFDSTPDVNDMVFDYNCIYQTQGYIGTISTYNYSTLSAWQNNPYGAQDVHSVFGDPLFTSIQDNNFELASSDSSAYHTGVYLPDNVYDFNRNPWNNPPSAGAYERFLVDVNSVALFNGYFLRYNNQIVWVFSV